MEITTIIEQLRNLDLSTYDPKDETLRNEIVGLLNQVKGIACMKTTFHKGKVVVRARLDDNNGERFEMKSDYSYKPQGFNTTYQRASTPNQTMFYAAVEPDDKSYEDDSDNALVTAIAETVPMTRDITKSGTQKVSFGDWSVHEDIVLLEIIQRDKYSEINRRIKEAADTYEQFMSSTSPKDKEDILAFTTFLADEFSKDVKRSYDYMISALFSELMIKNHTLDGILYPSVKIGGRGFNIAITPEATKKLRLCKAAEYTIYQHKDIICPYINAEVKLNGTEEVFKLVDRELDVKQILACLGVTSIDELK